MEKLKRLIGPAPSELSREDLLRKIQARQDFVAGMLQEFRTRMEGGRSAKGPTKAPRVKGEASSLAELLAGMKKLGLTVEDLKKVKVC